MDNYQICQDLLAKARKLDDCLIFSGVVNDKGQGRITVNGKTWPVHRFVYVYNTQRTSSQVANISRIKVYQNCGRTNCISPYHLTIRKPEKKYVDLVPYWETIGASS